MVDFSGHRVGFRVSGLRSHKSAAERSWPWVCLGVAALNGQILYHLNATASWNAGMLGLVCACSMEDNICLVGNIAEDAGNSGSFASLRGLGNGNNQSPFDLNPYRGGDLLIVRGTLNTGRGAAMCLGRREQSFSCPVPAGAL